MSPSPRAPFRRSSPPFPIPDWVAAKIGIGLLGLAIFGLGLWLFRSAHATTEFLNRIYDDLPGGFRYPGWWARMFGVVFMAFGTLLMLIAIVAADGQCYGLLQH